MKDRRDVRITFEYPTRREEKIPGHVWRQLFYIALASFWGAIWIAMLRTPS